MMNKPNPNLQPSINFLSGPNAPFIEELYAKYLSDPNSVDESWQNFFADLSEEAAMAAKDLRGASWSPRERDVEIGYQDTQTTYTPDPTNTRSSFSNNQISAADQRAAAR